VKDVKVLAMLSFSLIVAAHTVRKYVTPDCKAMV
jgi:hypothetical protein